VRTLTLTVAWTVDPTGNAPAIGIGVRVAVAGAFPVGSTVQATVNVNVRTGAGTTNTIIGLMTAGTRGTVTGSPIAQGGYLWHPLNIPGIGSGWVAGSFLSQVSGAGVTAAEQPDLEIAPTSTVAPQPTIMPTLTPAATVDDTPRPYEIVRIQRIDGSEPGQVLVDEDAATVWTAPGYPDQQVALFVADLGAVQDISTIRWQPGAAGVAGELYVSLSTNGQEWIDLDLEGAYVDEEWITIDIDASAEFVRFAFIAVDESPILGGISEVEIWP